jgi:hypothetical protein
MTAVRRGSRLELLTKYLEAIIFFVRPYRAVFVLYVFLFLLLFQSLLWAC